VFFVLVFLCFCAFFSSAKIFLKETQRFDKICKQFLIN
jgi:hypothetical protein